MTLLTDQHAPLSPPASAAPPRTPPRTRSLALILVAWFILQIGSLFTPGLLDDVDSIYTEVAREMLHRHDFVTPYVDGIRFFDKPPLMYWLSAGSMSLFGEQDWAARLPLALAALALLLALYALGNRLFGAASPIHASDRAGLYTALALVTSLGPYLYTRFYIPDILVALWTTLALHLLLIATERASATPTQHPTATRSLLPAVGFGLVLALNVLTKGLIGLLFPVAIATLYLVVTRQLSLLKRLHLAPAALAFTLFAAPWHILAALRNPPIPMPPGLGLPATAGWAWFYLYNEHVARFLGHRVPHDYGQVPVAAFLFYAFLWMMPWAAFLPTAIATHLAHLRSRSGPAAIPRDREAAALLLCWSGLILAFFALSFRQEYYSLPALPALALMAGGILARADTPGTPHSPAENIHRWSLYFLLPVTVAVGAISAYFALSAPRPAERATLSDLLAANPSLYNLSLGHLSDLTRASLGLFRGPLLAVTLGMLLAGPVSYLLRRFARTFAANLTLAAAMLVTLLAVHEGLVRFYPILGSRALALATRDAFRPGDMIVLDGEFTSGSSLAFYTGQPVHLVHGRVNTLWFGSFWTDAPQVFESDESLHRLWSSPHQVFLFTPRPAARNLDLAPFGPVRRLAADGGKSILVNRP